MEILFNRPKIEEIILDNKPVPYQGKDYPLHSLEHYDFERLVYCLYKEELNKSINFDSIALMSGVRDDGKDCAFFKDNLLAAIIQCKHSQNNKPLQEASCAKEIIKYCLYSIQDKSLLADISTFIYYFASSSDFDSKAKNLLSTFTKAITRHKKLEYWTTQVLTSYKSLEQFRYAEVKDDLLSVLSQLKVSIIIPTDIQTLLNKPYNQHIISKFFDVRTVIDNTEVNKLSKKIDALNFGDAGSLPKSNTIIKEFKEASCYLSEQVKIHFSTKQNIFIERAVTSDLLNWIKSDVQQTENICILKGHAGSGKTVVLNSVFHKLAALGMPVIALKADAREIFSIADLEEKFGLSYPLVNSLEVLRESYEKIIVIIDQLDALSQSLSANREALQTYILLINKLKGMQGIRVVVSTREYDLNYDADLVPLKKFATFDSGLLTEEEVKSILTDLCVTGYTDKLLRLLQTPLHLELFCQVYNTKSKNTQFFSLYDLYNELWSEKFDKKSKRKLKDNHKAILYDMADKMYSKQLTVVNLVPYNAEDLTELVSNGLITKRNSKEIQFFHQTFYDYLFARQFVEKERKLKEYLIENNQGLFIRSSLKIILSYLRDFDIRGYEKLITELITDKLIRFHLMQLIITFLGFVQEPSKEEKVIVREILFNTEFEVLFIESIYSTEWLVYCLDERLIQRYYESKEPEKENLILRVFMQNCDTSRDVILQYLFTLVPDETNHYLINRVLWVLNSWNVEALELFKQVKDKISNQYYQYCEILKKAIEVDEKWVFYEYKENLTKRANELCRPGEEMIFDHSEEIFLKELFKYNTHEALLLCEDVLYSIVKSTAYATEDDKLYADGAYFHFSRKSNSNGQEEFLEIFIEEIEKLAVNTSPIFFSFLKRNCKSNSETILTVLFYGILANSTKFCTEAFEIIKIINKKEELEGNGKIQFLIRQIITKSYPLLTPEKKQALNEMILEIGVKRKKATYTNPTTKKKYIIKNYGYYRYLFLSAIPKADRDKVPILKISFLELERKFGATEDKEPNVIRISGVYAPYSTGNYKKMNLSNWEKSFYKINAEYQQDRKHSFAGGVVEHSRAFEKEVAGRPEFFFPLIEKIITDKKVDTYYMVQGINGLIKAKFDVEKTYNLYIHLIGYQNVTKEYVIYSIWNSDYFIKNNYLTETLLDFLIFQAINGQNELKDERKNPLSRAINTVRGAAIDRLVKIDTKIFEEKIFETLNKIIDSEPLYYLRATIVIHSAYLLNINPDRAFELFVRAIKLDNKLISVSIWSADYFANHYFEKMTFFFEEAIKGKDVEDKYNNLAIILAKAWLRDKTDSERLLFLLLKKSNKAKAAIIDVAIHSENIIKNGGLDKKCVKLFQLYLNSTDKDIVHEYSRLFLRLDTNYFEILFPLLKKYSLSKAFKTSPAYFCEYIIKCSKQNIYKCVELIDGFDKLLPTDITKSSHYESEPIQVILAIYNTLSDSTLDKTFKEKCMNMFDKMLQIPHLRNAANKAVELVDK